MKPSEKRLGLAIQLLLMRSGLQIEELAQQMGITGDALSNLIHGRRRFKDDTLVKLANTPALQEEGLLLSQLRALRAVDEYKFEELILALVEYIRQGEIERLPKDFFQNLQASMERDGVPPSLASKRHALFSLIQEDPL
ncbi:helix-turn-helix domain-containing protein [Vampirovibrio chlorellavorus]|uniref:helix-turn-helix domain-containing protein n=1 Tax=Vampirovibrio chlorellavorus TaxID=758823 RepID=UPI0026EAB6F0|nr:helix-turn-helix transcriptional regulator [Vampirovibrio chlorellavorus]